MEHHDFAIVNKYLFSQICCWRTLLGELGHARCFLDELGFLTFGRDCGVIRSCCGFRPVYVNQILQSAMQTLQSMAACAEHGNIADVHILLRKLRDDLFFYLYVIWVCRNNNILSSETLSKQEEYINMWSTNQLSHLKISEVIRDITETECCKELVEKFALKDELKQIGKALNNYTHGNGTLYYNRFYTHYKEDEIEKISTELIYILKYILVIFLFLLVLLCPDLVMASDYADALDFAMPTEMDRQYWIAPFVSEFMMNHRNLLGKNAFEYLCTITQMEL